MKIRSAILIALGLLAPSARLLVAQAAPSSGTDITGTWVINRVKSDFGMMAPPTIDSSTVTRAGTMYQIDGITDFGGQGTQHRVLKWPIGEGETTTDLPNGATIHTTTKLQHDTTTFSSTISVQGQTVALQTGRMYRSADGKTLTRELEVQPLVGQDAQPMHFRLVYDRR
jgi:hypothetical protein